MRARTAVFIVAVVSLLLGLPPTGPASAVGASNVEFSVNGTLPRFPCPNGCSTGFSGSGTGSGHIDALVGTTAYDATFTILAGSVNGNVNYTEPGIPFCPSIGSAAGNVTLTGNPGNGTNGIVYRSSSPFLTGSVTGVTFSFGFTYVRVGATPAIIITGGSVTVDYYFPDTGPGWITSGIVAGSGSGVFVVDPAKAVADCLDDDPLPFQIIGNAVVATL